MRLQKLLFLIVISCSTLLSHSQCSDLYFSEYIEGSSSNKAIEIYNPTSSAIDFSNYTIKRFNNGGTSPSGTYSFIGLISSKGVYIIANSSANPAILNKAVTTSALTFYNGDDALILINDITGDTIDAIGEIGVDPGAGWVVGTGATNNFTLVRKISIQEGQKDWTIGATEWDVFPIDVFDSLGAHTVNPCGAQPLAITAIVDNNVSCINGFDGSATGNASGGTSPYTYNWSNGSSNATATGLAAGSYTVIVTDNGGATASDNVTITQPTALNATITSSQNASCNGSADGSIVASAGGGTSPYSYLWSNGDTTSSISSLAAGTYSLTVIDANGCASFNTGSISQPSALSLNLVLTDVSTNGGSDGAASATVSGGTPAYTYLWSTSATSTSISNLTAGAYALTISDANSCDSIVSFSINQPTSISSSITTTDVSCNGGSDGTASVTTSGGTMPYTYNWSNGLVGSTITGLVANSYTVTITDGSGSTATNNAVINEPTALIVTTVVDSNVSVNGGSDGGATASATGGITPYNYLWSNGANTTSITGITAGTYTVTLTDANGCTNSTNVQITEPLALTLSATVTDISCNGGSDGSIQLSVSNGTMPYNFNWITGDTSQNLSGLNTGSYSVTVTDANMATVVGSYNITQPVPVTLSMIVDSNVSCNGIFDGGLTIVAMGGIAPYNYSWSSGNTALTAQSFETSANDTWNFTANPATYNTEGDSVVAGSDDVWAVIREFSGNIDSASNGTHFWGIQDINNSNGGGAFYHTLTFDPINIANETGLTIKFDYYSVGFDGTDEIEYEVAFDNDTTWSPIGTALNKNTQAWTTVEIAVPDSANHVRLRLQADQNGGSDYAAFDNVSLIQSSISITGLAAGNYTVSVTDANGCLSIDSGLVTEPVPLMDSIVVTNATAIGAADGSLDLTVFGGTVPYTYSWSNGVTTEDNNNLIAGTYTVTITDANGCSIQDSETVQDPANITLSVTSADVSCNGNFDGSITVNPSGGIMPYSYNWSPSSITGQGTNTVTNLGAGQYNVTVSDAVGTTVSSMITVLEPTAITTSLFVTNESAQGAGDGAITANVFGGVPPYTYNWSAGASSTPTISNLTAGTYCVTVSDASGCTNVECGTVMAPGAIAQLVITEINYNGPESGTDTSEFIEFVNVGMNTIPLNGYTFTQGVSQSFTVNDSITAGQYYVIAYDSSSFRNRYGFDADAVWTAGGLSNGGEDIIIVDNFGRSIDTVDYDDNAPWPAGFTAGGPDGGGASIELVDSTLNNNDGANWVASPTALTGAVVNGFQVYGTPGRGAILVGIEDNEIEDQIISIYPNPTNGLITLELKGTQINERVKLVSIDGKLLRDELTDKNRTQMDLSSLANGIYFLRIGDSVQKIVLNR